MRAPGNQRNDSDRARHGANRDRRAQVSLDVVIPVWNEEAVLGSLFERLSHVFSPDQLQHSRIDSVRYLFVDDGSTDRTPELVANAIADGLPAVMVRFSRNFGHQNAVSAGLDHTDADVVAVIDADLQDPPELIPAMLEKWRAGWDVVYGQRRKRRGENPLKLAGYWLFYRLLAALADIHIPLDSGDFCLMDRRVVEVIVRVPERLRFPRGIRAWVGFRQTSIEYERPLRRAGRTKYNFARLYKLATDGVISSSVRPLQLAQVFSVSYLVLALAVGLLLLLSEQTQVPPLILVGYLLIVSGNFVQVFCIYILGAYVGRTYLEVKGRPSYVVMEILGRANRRSEER